MTRRDLAIIAFFLTALVASPAAAQSAPPGDRGVDSLDDLSTAEKRELLDTVKKANELYNAGEYPVARVYYDRAYAMYREPNYLYRIALCLEREKQWEQALEYYRRYLEEAPDTDRRGKVEKTISELEQKLTWATLRIVTDPPNATVVVGTREEHAGRTPLELDLPAGTHRIAVRLPDHEPRVELVELEPESSRTVEFELVRLPPRMPESDPAYIPGEQPRPGSPTGLIVATSILGVSTIGATIGWGLAFASYRDLETRAEGERAAPMVNVLAASSWGLGVMTALFGTLTVLKLGATDDQRRVAVGVHAVGGGAALKLGTTW